MPPVRQLAKFAGLATCPTWNFGGNPASAAAALASPAIARRVLVSKNVCHDPRAAYTPELHSLLGEACDAAAAECGARGGACAAAQRRALALQLLHRTMAADLQRRLGRAAGRGDGKLKQLHDPLALAVALDESVAELAEVELYRERGRWGSRLHPGSATWIATGFDPAAFHCALLSHPRRPTHSYHATAAAAAAPPPTAAAAAGAARPPPPKQHREEAEGRTASAQGKAGAGGPRVHTTPLYPAALPGCAEERCPGSHPHIQPSHRRWLSPAAAHPHYVTQSISHTPWTCSVLECMRE